MLEFRSIVYQVLFVVVLALFCIVCLPFFLVSRRRSLFVMRAWSSTNEALLRLMCGLRFEIRGQEHLPRGAALVASKHQSAWETMSFLHILPAPAMVLKKELIFIPFFGWYCLKFRHLWVDRSGGGSAIKSLLRRARGSLSEDRQITIFPEGTRKVPGAAPDYQRGIAALYRDLKVPCVPVALNSGVYWKRRDWRRRPGTIIVEFLEPIPPELNGRAFMAELQARIEPATERLVAEAQSGLVG